MLVIGKVLNVSDRMVIVDFQGRTKTREMKKMSRWMWLKTRQLKRENETLIVAAQDEAVRTSYIKAEIDETRDNPNWRMCNQMDETVSHIVGACPKMAQKEYK